MKILVLNGPNINMLGIREPSIYGKETYQDLVDYINKWSNELNIEVEVFQSNHEGVLIDKIQEAYYHKIDGIIINGGGYTHTSIAILDALKSVQIPTVEVHISDIKKRDAFRTHSYIGLYAFKSIMGYGLNGYKMALVALKEKLEESK